MNQHSVETSVCSPSLFVSNELSEFLSSVSARDFHSPTFPKLLPFLLSQNRCFIQMEQNIYLKRIVIEMTKQGSRKDQLADPNSFIL